jgi:hypothetical protein
MAMLKHEVSPLHVAEVVQVLLEGFKQGFPEEHGAGGWG